MSRWFGFDPDTPAAVRGRVAAVLLAAVIAMSSSAVIVRGMGEVDPLAVAAWRTLGSAAVLLPWARSVGGLGVRDLVAIVAAGVALALHFWTWFASVSATTVLRSTLLVCTVPAWTALLEWLVFRIPPARRHWLGLAVALPGLALLGGSGGGLASARGDGLALVAAVLWSVYFLLSREVRQRVGAGATMVGVCATAAAVLFPVGLGLGTPLVGFDAPTWGLIGLAVLGPQLVGHLGLVYAVRWVPASTVSMITLLEPVGAAALAAVVLREVPGAGALFGSAIVLVGIAVATRQPPASRPR